MTVISPHTTSSSGGIALKDIGRAGAERDFRRSAGLDTLAAGLAGGRLVGGGSSRGSARIGADGAGSTRAPAAAPLVGPEWSALDSRWETAVISGLTGAFGWALSTAGSSSKSCWFAPHRGQNLAVRAMRTPQAPQNTIESADSWLREAGSDGMSGIGLVLPAVRDHQGLRVGYPVESRFACSVPRGTTPRWQTDIPLGQGLPWRVIMRSPPRSSPLVRVRL